MPLGIQQNNDFTQFTMDVWNDKIFYQEQEFPAGFMAMSILNIPEEELPELIQAGGAPTFLFPVVVQGGDEEAAAAFPQLRERRRSLLIAALYHHREQEGRCAAGLYQLRQFFFGNVQNGHRHESRRKLLLLIKDLVIPDIHCELREIVVLLYSQRHSIAPLSHIRFIAVR